MALVEVGFANVQVGDSADKLASASFRVSVADAKAYVAAADQTARDATDVGKLLTRSRGIMAVDASTGYKHYECGIRVVNDAFAYPDESVGLYNSNKWKITASTTNGGLPAIDTVYVPNYLITGVVMESDGVSADLSDTPVAEFVTEFIATALSKYGTAFTVVLSIKRNDS